MTAPDRAYDSARRPNIFYKNDPFSNEELGRRAKSRGQMWFQHTPKNASETLSESIGVEMSGRQPAGMDSGTVSKSGKALENVNTNIHNDSASATSTVSGATVRGADIARGKLLGQEMIKRAGK